jgi:hypothetical protein
MNRKGHAVLGWGLIGGKILGIFLEVLRKTMKL